MYFSPPPFFSLVSCSFILPRCWLGLNSSSFWLSSGCSFHEKFLVRCGEGKGQSDYQPCWSQWMTPHEQETWDFLINSIKVRLGFFSAACTEQCLFSLQCCPSTFSPCKFCSQFNLFAALLSIGETETQAECDTKKICSFCFQNRILASFKWRGNLGLISF